MYVCVYFCFVLLVIILLEILDFQLCRHLWPDLMKAQE